MKNYKLISTFIGLIISPLCFAGTMGDVKDSGWSKVIGLSLGGGWDNGGKTQTFYLQPNVQKTYTSNGKYYTLGTAELFLGYQHCLHQKIHGQLGLALLGTTNAKVGGDILEDADPDFNNYLYQYKINHAHIALKGKLIADLYPTVQPYLSGSLGVGFNHSHGFTITPKIFEEVAAPPFADHTTTAFVYNIGLGVQKNLDNHWQMGVGYEFSDWGKSRLSPSPAQLISSSIQLNHLYTNTIQVSMTYVA